MSSQDPTANKEPADLTMFTYPWDLYLDGVENSVKLVRDLGCQRVAVAVAYHSAELVSPRRGRSVHQAVEANVAHLALPARFSGIAIRSGQLVAEAPGLAERLRAAADNEGLRLTAWAVVCHNSELRVQVPWLRSRKLLRRSFNSRALPITPVSAPIHSRAVYRHTRDRDIRRVVRRKRRLHACRPRAPPRALGRAGRPGHPLFPLAVLLPGVPRLREPARLQVAQTLWPAHHAGLDVLLEKVSLARSLGISAFGLYNLTTATVPTLEWARAVGTALSHDRD